MPQTVEARFSMKSAFVSPITLVGIIIVGLLIRIFVILTLDDPWISGPDAESYVASGNDLNSQGVFANSEALRTFPVGYAAILSPFLRMNFAPSGVAFLLFQSIFFAVTLLFFVMISRRFLNNVVPTIVIIFATASPALIDATTSVQYEGLLVSLSFALLTVLIMLAFSSHVRSSILLLALITSFMTFIHPRMILVGIIIVFVVAMQTRRVFPSLVILLMNMFACFLLIIRNSISVGVPSLSFNLGTNWYLGLPGVNNACADIFVSGAQLDQSLPAVDGALQECSVAWIIQNPLNWLQLLPLKLLAHFEPFILRILGALTNWDGRGIRSSWEPAASEFNFIQVGNALENRWTSLTIAILFFLIITVLVVMGLVAMVNSSSNLKLLAWSSLAIIIAVALPSLAFFGMLRFRIPSTPFILFLVAFGIQQLVVWFRSKSRVK